MPSELQKLSDEAPGGPWTYSGGDSVSGWTIYDTQWSLTHMTVYDHNNPLSNRPGATGPGYIDPDAVGAFIVALVNAFREGRLVEANPE